MDAVVSNSRNTIRKGSRSFALASRLFATTTREHAWMLGANALFLNPETTRDDDAAIGGHRLADRGQAFLFRRIEKAAGVDHHHVGAGVVGREHIALGAQLGDDTLAIDQRLGAAERDDADAGGGLGLGGGLLGPLGAGGLRGGLGGLPAG